MEILLTVLAVFGVICLSELGWRKHWLNNEFGRKFTHILVGTFVAFWPFYLSWNEIRLLSAAFVVAIIISHYLKLFGAIHSVQRPTYGELFFALVVGGLTFVTESKGVYAAALLQMSLADGLAAIVGTRYGRENKYHVLGHTKSIAGTATFFVTSFVILLGYSMLAAAGLPIVWVFVGAAVASALENVAVFGLDNFLVPVFIASMLLVV
jgi:phytol kinase